MRPPVFDIDMESFRSDPYPVLAEMRANAPIAYVPQLGAIVFTRRDDIFVCEKNIDVFSSHQPEGLMNKLMGHNMMRKDGEAHQRERKMIFPSVSPKTVRDIWQTQFKEIADQLVDDLMPKGGAELVTEYAMPLSGEALKVITGLTNITYNEMDQWSQAMIDGIANYHGDPDVEASCHDATAAIDAAIDEMIPVLRKQPDHSLLSVMMQAGLEMDSTRANVKLAISGGQNEPRDAIAGCAWALLTHAAELEKVQRGEVTWLQVFEEYARWISPIGMSPRRVAKHHSYESIDFEPEDRVFFMFGSANRDESVFDEASKFDVERDNQKSIPFGAGPHFCAGAWASRSLVAEVALPTLFSRFDGLRPDAGQPVNFDGWAFRGPQSLAVKWEA
ncbi:MAG: cytochrome P450 [Rhizobiaceae bacterium]